MRPLHRILIATSCVVALLAAGCGGGSSKPSPEVTKLLGDTFGANKPVSSGRLDVRLAADTTGVAGLQGPLDLRFTGPFQSQGAGKMAKFDFDLALRRGGSTLRAGAVSTGDKGYLKLVGNSYALDAKSFSALRKSGGRTASSAGKQGGLSLRRLGIDPRRWLQDAKVQGTEQVAGTPAIHISAGIEVGPMLADVNKLLGRAGSLGAAAGAGPSVPTSLDAATRRKIEKAVQKADLDVWTGKADHALRRIRVNVRFDVPEDERADRGKPEKGTIGLDLTIGGLNERQAIGAPADPKPIGELTAALQQVLTQAQSQGQGGAGSAGSGSASGQPKYDACVQAAGSDISRAQQCAPLLGQ